MTRSTRVLGSALIVSLVVFVTTSRAQEQSRNPFAPPWANLAGATVFAEKGCGLCHAIRELGATAGPNLSRIERRSFFDLGAAMSNHLRGINIRKPTLSGDEVNSLISFLFTLQYGDPAGDPAAGQALFTTKSCAQCHEVGGKGGRRGPGLDFLKGADSPVLVAAALWNHGPEMAEQLRRAGIPRPSFDAKELVDIIAYIHATAQGTGGMDRVTPGVPESGMKLFSAKRCVVCHSVAGKGGKVGPPLGRGQHVSLTNFAALMWNHGPNMWARMRERGIEVPRISGQEMADIVAYLYVSHYFDQEVDASRGREVLEAKGCFGCHATSGKGGKIGADLSRYRKASSAAGLVAALWNHPRYLEKQRQEVPWPLLTGQELADMSAYISGLSRPHN